MLTRLKESRIGCYIGNTFCGAIGYADDVSLLCPSLTSLRRLVSITEAFGKEFNVQFHSKKYQLMGYGTDTQPAQGIYYNDCFVKALG